ncbi:hypothetical protein [Microbacterium pumilum]|uniref:Caspase family protein n=1 Tax=Microbacterium pumilum TaxID=344165 RepID=A0ABP5D5Q2_9MICO
MERALVLIGVSKTGGGLAPLNAVEAGLDEMTEWAKRQKIRRIHRISDAGGTPVTAKAVHARIKKLCDLKTIDQLIVYFTGHGVTVGQEEYLLLSGAPTDLGEAIYVQGSAAAAALSPVGNIVLISDACRSDAEGSFRNLRGAVIFPGYAGDDEPKVDRLYAAPLGSAAYEVVDEHGVSHPIYTESLVATLDGAHPQIVEPDEDPAFGIVRLRRGLQDILAEDVVNRLGALKVPLDISQRPKVWAVSDSTISRVALTAEIVPGGVGARPGGTVSAKGDPVVRLRDLMRGLAGLPAEAHVGRLGALNDLVVIADPRLAAQTLGDGVADPAARPGQNPFTAAHDRSPTGRIVVSGATVASAECDDADVLVSAGAITVEPARDTLAMDVVLRLDDDSGVILPSAASVTTVATFAGGELRDVAFVGDPAAAVNIDAQRLRGAVAARMRINDLWLTGDECDALLAAVLRPDGCDPTLALYTAYVLHDLKRRDDVRLVDDAVRAQWGFRLFDLAMLTGDLDGRTPTAEDEVHPATPLLQRGWSTVRIKGIDLGDGLDGIPAHLLPSIWTQVDGDGIEILRRARRDQSKEEQ